MRVHLYAGDWDALLSHWGGEVGVANMTWCGKQGFQRRPDRRFVVAGEGVVGRWGVEVGFPFLFHRTEHG